MVGFEVEGRRVGTRDAPDLTVGKELGGNVGVNVNRVGHVVGCSDGSSVGSNVGGLVRTGALVLRPGRSVGLRVGLAVGVEVPRPRTVSWNLA